jgi:hypothetical protein
MHAPDAHAPDAHAPDAHAPDAFEPHALEGCAKQNFRYVHVFKKVPNASWC